MSQPATTGRLQRVLKLKDLLFYGIVLITPIAPVGVFGVASRISQGHAATTIVAAMVAMVLTAVSYGRMAALYPAAGSAYTYVSRGLNEHLGFLAGWAMILDYLIIPVINVAYVALTIQRLSPWIPYWIWTLLVAAGMTALNLRGIRTTARANTGLLAVMSVVIAAFLVLAVRYLWTSSGWSGLLSMRPFYNPATFDLRAVSTATALAALTYIGFDGVTTLAEEVENPRRNLLLATVLTCVITGLLSTLEVYLAQRVWPDYRSFSNPETAFLDVTGRVGGTLLFQAMAAVLIVSCFGSGLAGQVGAARLLFGMGRDGVLPRRMFAHLSLHSGNPTYNILFIGLLAFCGATLMSWERAVELLNFGAFLSFMGVNLTVIRAYGFRGARRNWFLDVILPALGFLFCLWIFLSLRTPAKIVGGIWLAAGITYDAVKTRGFRTPPARVSLDEKQEGEQW
jgi:amino acid transporter